MNLEKKLYDLIDNLDQDNMSGLGIGIHESSIVDCRFPEEENGYKVYHKDGYCFEITFEKQFDEEENEIEPNYEYHEGMYDGFKSLTLEEAISIIEKEGVFV